MKSTTWAEALRDILRAAGVRQSEIADELKMEERLRPTINRYVHGDRRPDSETVIKINRAVARLSGHDGVEAYLNFEATACGLLAEENQDEALASGAARCLHWYGRFLKPGSIPRILNAISESGDLERRKLILGLNRALRRIIVSELMPASRPVGFQAVLDALAAGGIDVNELVSLHSARQLAWEHFVHVVQRELLEQNPDSPARGRIAAAQRIIDALANPDVLAAFEATRNDSAQDALHEVTTMEGGKLVSRFYGDPRAAWASFTAPTNRANSNRNRRTGGKK